MRPLCLGASGSVRATSMHHLASWANVVQTFWPVTIQPPFVLDRLASSARRGRSRTRARRSPGTRSPRRRGSARGSAPSAPRCRGRSPPGRPSPGRARSPARGALARAISSLKIACSISVAPRPPYSFGHETPAQPAVVQLALPVAAELELRLVVAVGRRAGMVVLEPGAHLVAEGLLVGCEGEVHRAPARAGREPYRPAASAGRPSLVQAPANGLVGVVDADLGAAALRRPAAVNRTRRASRAPCRPR